MKKKAVLIVDDDENIRELYKTALESAGILVYTAENGSIGVHTALQKHPDVIMMDIMMPIMNGHDAVKKIRSDSWGRTHAKIIYLTNLSDPADVVEAIKQSPEKYIVKANTEIKEVINQVRIAMHQE